MTKPKPKKTELEKAWELLKRYGNHRDLKKVNRLRRNYR